MHHRVVVGVCNRSSYFVSASGTNDIAHDRIPGMGEMMGSGTFAPLTQRCASDAQPPCLVGLIAESHTESKRGASASSAAGSIDT